MTTRTKSLIFTNLPIGAATCGTGNIGNASIATLSKDLRKQLKRNGSSVLPTTFDQENYTLEDVAKRARELFLAAIQETDQSAWLTYWIFGYSSGRSLPEVWSINISGRECPPPSLMADENWIGCRWAGEEEALDRLILGRSSAIVNHAVKLGIEREQVVEIVSQISPSLFEGFVLPAMPIQDAIDLARYFVNVTAGFMRFSITRPRTVGGLVDIAAITKHEGFKWIDRKHFYHRHLNPADDER